MSEKARVIRLVPFLFICDYCIVLPFTSSLAYLK